MAALDKWEKRGLPGDARTPFHCLCDVFETPTRGKAGKKKQEAKTKENVRQFLRGVYKTDYHSVLRLLLPDTDLERRSYGLKEASLAKAIINALGLATGSADAQKLVNWRKGGRSVGRNAGNFSSMAWEVLQKRQRDATANITIKEVNDYLDRLAAAENSSEKSKVLEELIYKTSAREMRWIIRIILREMKLGIGEGTIMKAFHPDAEHYMNMTSDLKTVAELCEDPNKRLPRMDIEVGRPVRPQLASRKNTVEEAWKQMRGKRVVVECKFDGERIQVHKNGANINFFSRNAIDHVEYKDGMAKLLSECIIPDKCILDGELLVWDQTKKQFAPFGQNQTAARVARDGEHTDQQLCYIAFDILYDGNSSVIHRSLFERQELLHKAVRPVKHKFEILIPEDPNGLDAHREAGEPLWSKIVTTQDEVQHFFVEMIENREEGIVMKDLESKWEPGVRDKMWIKLKPDYINVESDLDVLIIGGYHGSGRHGGKVAQFLLGLKEKPGISTKFVSFCKVGTGLSDAELEILVGKLSPYFVPKGRTPPACYKVTNHGKETPDVWVSQPNKSVILQIKSDIRSIQSEVFAAPHSLRFPRVERVRYDKPWEECLDIETLEEMVHEGYGSMAHDHGDGKKGVGARAPKRSKSERPVQPSFPEHLKTTDVSDVERKTSIFENFVFYFVNFSAEHPKEEMHRLAVENGGTFSMNLTSAITHTIADEKKGLRYQGAAAYSDVIHSSWFLDCVERQQQLPLKPKHYLHLSPQTRERFADIMDEFGDSFFEEISERDLRMVFENMDVGKLAIDSEDLKHAMRKYCPDPRWCLFSGMVVFFHIPMHSQNPDSQEVAKLALSRLGLEISMGGGSVASSFSSQVTHSIIYTQKAPNGSGGASIPLKSIAYSVPRDMRPLLKSPSVHVLSHWWIEDSLSQGKCPDEKQYELRDEADIVQLQPEVKAEGNVGSNQQEREEKKKLDGDDGEAAERAAYEARDGGRGRVTSTGTGRGRGRVAPIMRRKIRRGGVQLDIGDDDGEEAEVVEEGQKRLRRGGGDGRNEGRGEGKRPSGSRTDANAVSPGGVYSHKEDNGGGNREEDAGGDGRRVVVLSPVTCTSSAGGAPGMMSGRQESEVSVPMDRSEFVWRSVDDGPRIGGEVRDPPEGCTGRDGQGSHGGQEGGARVEVGELAKEVPVGGKREVGDSGWKAQAFLAVKFADQVPCAVPKSESIVGEPSALTTSECGRGLDYQKRDKEVRSGRLDLSISSSKQVESNNVDGGGSKKEDTPGSSMAMSAVTSSSGGKKFRSFKDRVKAFGLES